MESSSSTCPPTFELQSTTLAITLHGRLYLHLAHLQMARRLDLPHQQEPSPKRHCTRSDRHPTHLDHPPTLLAPQLLMVPLVADPQLPVASVLLRTLKEGFPVAGRDAKTTSEGHTTWTTTHGKQLGSDRPPTMMPASKETRCNSNKTWRGSGIKRVCCRKIGLAPTHRRLTATRLLRHQTR